MSEFDSHGDKAQERILRAVDGEQWVWLNAKGEVVGQSGRWRAEQWLRAGLNRSIAPVIQPGAVVKEDQ